MCLLFCFVLFWIFCYVVCEKIKKKIVDNKKKRNHIETISYRNRVFIIYIMYSGCVMFISAVLYALAKLNF